MPQPRDLSHISDRMLRVMAEAARDRAQVAVASAERYELELKRRAAAADVIDTSHDQLEAEPVHHVPQHIANVSHSVGRRLLLSPCGFDLRIHSPSVAAGVL